MDASPSELRIEAASHSSRSWLAASFGRTYPAFLKPIEPHRCSLRHTPTRSLAFAPGNVKTSSNQGALSEIRVTSITYKCYDSTKREGRAHEVDHSQEC